MGTVLYVVSGIGEIKFSHLVTKLMPFLLVEITVLFLLLFIFVNKISITIYILTFILFCYISRQPVFLLSV